MEEKKQTNIWMLAQILSVPVVCLSGVQFVVVLSSSVSIPFNIYILEHCSVTAGLKLARTNRVVEGQHPCSYFRLNFHPF